MIVMPSTISPAVADARVLSSESPRRMAKVHSSAIRKPDTDCRALVGGCVDRARQLLGWSLKEFADAVQHDERQVARWISGQERAQFDALFAVDALRGPLVIALAGLCDQIEVTTQITIRSVA